MSPRIREKLKQVKAQLSRLGAVPKVKAQLSRLGRAKLRHSLMTKLPDRLLGGVLKSRHLARKIHVREVELQIANWPAAFSGIRIAHVSDLHVGELLPVARAVEVAQLVTGARPDLLACTGDMVDLHIHGEEPLGEALQAFAAVSAPLGHWLVLGNHDHLDDAQEVRRLARLSGFTVLDGHVKSVAPLQTHAKDETRLRIGGVDWTSTLRRSAASVDALCDAAGAPHILLAHNPKAFRRAAALQIPLVLSGHTHGGQFSLRRAHSTKSARGNRLLSGHYVDGDSSLFVTTGVGAWFPLRVNCPPEVVLLTVTRAR